MTTVLNDKDSANEAILSMAMELSDKKWQLSCERYCLVHEQIKVLEADQRARVEEPADQAMAQRLVLAVVSAEITRILVGDAPPVPAGRRQSADTEQLRDELRMVHDLIAAAEAWILVADRVETMGASPRKRTNNSFEKLAARSVVPFAGR